MARFFNCLVKASLSVHDAQTDGQPDARDLVSGSTRRALQLRVNGLIHNYTVDKPVLWSNSRRCDNDTADGSEQLLVPTELEHDFCNSVLELSIRF